MIRIGFVNDIVNGYEVQYRITLPPNSAVEYVTPDVYV